MKFSVLLPTRNRLEYLRYAIETVRRQDYDDWEIIVSDNCSEDDIHGYVESLDDSRVRYFRTESFLPVTENWNNALDRSVGDYVIMLGDDDGLLPRFFSRMRAAIETFPDPDFVYVSAYFYAYPGVMPDEPEGFLRRDENQVFREPEPFWLDRKRADAVARGYLDFEMPVASNMQFSLISRRKIDDFKTVGPFFQSPYPDFYATPALFMTSDRILIYPKPMVIVGISPKSYGFFHFNNKTTGGVEFLNNTEQLAVESAIRLPGTSYNDSWLLANEALRKSFGEARGLLPAYRRYRFLQIVNGFKHAYFDRSVDTAALKPLKARMNGYERAYGAAMAAGFTLLRVVPNGIRDTAILRLRRLIGQHSISPKEPIKQRFENLLQVFDEVERSER